MLSARIDTADTYTLMPVAEANRKARYLNSEDEDGWSYEAVHDPLGTGGSFIKVFDEEGYFLGKL